MQHAMLMAALVLGATSVLAHSGDHASGAVPLGHAWDFTLPVLDGSRFVQASALNGPVLVSFTGKDCKPCIGELPQLEAFAKSNPQWTVLLVSPDAPADAQAFIQRHSVQLTVLRAGANVRTLMRRAGNGAGSLPFTVALRANRQDARICGGHFGELTSTELARFAIACQAKAPL